MNINHTLNSKEALTSLIISKGITTWGDLLKHVNKLPYGRNSNRTDLSLVLKEGKGSCSSKHAFLKKVAVLNKIPNVELILGIYKMNEKNTPNIGSILSENHIDFIPEAHCYLKINNERIDITTQNSDFKKLENDILEEIEIEAKQVAEFKVKYHQKFLKNWIATNNINHNFDELWAIREQCIDNLSKNIS